VSINAGSGVLNWTPTEAQGPSNYVVTVRVFDNGSPSLVSTQSFTIIVNEVNVAPVLTNLNNTLWTVNEQTTITLTNRGSDADVPTNILTYEIVSAPTGATVDPSTGLFSWTPSEAQGPSSNTILVRVFDNGTPTLSATQRFSVVVNEVNSPPVLSSIGDKTVATGQLLSFSNVVNDPDLPAQALSFSLGAGAPAGANVDAASGVFTWTPSSGQSPSTNSLSIRVADDGTPSLSATQTFTVFVVAAIRITDIHPLSASQMSITWETEVGKSYQLEYRDNWNSTPGWQPLSGTQATADGTSRTVTVSTTSSSQRFYRVARSGN